MAERSKALASGASQVIGVGLNPTLVMIFVCSEVIILNCYLNVVWKAAGLVW
ncbi:hypothetical protein LZ32DRAFT_604103 [Colletotrichum eremochloae]|nr:hypothetical protein LZ32DRAFT_604103 [Colletotrichum eremochloae]